MYKAYINLSDVGTDNTIAILLILIMAPNLLLRALDLLGRKREIPDRSEQHIYITRYYLLFQGRLKKLPNIFLHHIQQSDPEDYHDHPWNWAALILKGGYWEETPTGNFWRGAGSFRTGDALALHRLKLDRQKAGGETWTLFFTGFRVREWGFTDKSGHWMQWEQYIDYLNGRTEPAIEQLEK